MLLLIAASIAGAPWSLILILAAVILFILAALNVGSPKFSLGWAGLACFAVATALG